ncbi:hypothetical protein RTP6_004181 [Batrachochytrium dendrobatidis]
MSEFPGENKQLEEDWTDIPLETRLSHKSWKARQSAYDELAKLFRTAESGNDPIFLQYQESVRGMLSDANQIALESGVSATMEYVKLATIASRGKSVLVPLVVDKCLASTRSSTKTKAMEILLMFIEIDTADVVIECLIAGLSHKTPKNVIACVSALREVIASFGIPVVPFKPVAKVLSKIFDHRDKTVRAEGTALALELFRWIRQALLGSLDELKPLQLKELTTLFEQEPTVTPQATRVRRADMLKVEALKKEATVLQQTEQTEPTEVFDEFQFVDPVDVLGKLSKSFYSDLLSTKWKERKEALDGLLVILSCPKIEDGRYGELINALAKKLPDANVTVVVVAAQCITQLAKGLRSAFSQYRHIVIGPILDRLKEKKTNVIEALKASLDAVSATASSILDVMEDIVFGMTHKNPQIKIESVQWLLRCLTTIKKPKKDFTRSSAKLLLDTLFKGIDDSLESVREASAEALGHIMVTLGEQSMLGSLERLDKVKQTRIREYYSNIKSGNAKGVAPSTGKTSVRPLGESQNRPASQQNTMAHQTLTQMVQDKENRMPATGKGLTSNMSAQASSASSRGTAAVKRKGVGSAPSNATSLNAKTDLDEQPRFSFSDESAEEVVIGWIGTSLVADLSNSAWKIRLEAMQKISEMIGSDEPPIPSEAIVRFLSKKPGWKDNNFQVMVAMISIYKTLASHSSFTKGSVLLIISGCVDKMSDIKVKKVAGECMEACAERTSFSFVLSQLYEPAKKLKSPKAIADLLLWMGEMLSSFTTTGINVKVLVDFLKVSLGNSNAAVRTAAIGVFVTIYRCVGKDLCGLLNDVSPQIMAILDAEFEKVASIPRLVASKTQSNAPQVVDDILPRVDLSCRVPSSLVEQMGNPNWKERKAAMDELSEAIKATQMKIQPTLDFDLVSALKQRLSDSNKNLASSATDICGMLCIAMGKPFEKYVRTFLAPILSQLADQKTLVRAMATSALDRFADTLGISLLLSNIATCLKTDQPLMRKDLIKWLGERLALDSISTAPDANLISQAIFQCIQDRNQDVRKGAQLVLPLLIRDMKADTLRQLARDTYSGSTLATIVSQIDSVESETIDGAGSKSISSLKSKDILTQGKKVASIKSEIAATPVVISEPAQNSGENTLTTRNLLASSSLNDLKQSKIGVPLTKNRVSRTGSLVLKKEAVLAESSFSQVLFLPTDSRAKDARTAADRGVNRWAFDTPRRHLIEFLSEQCQLCLSSELHSLLFSTDHYKEKDFLAGLKMLDDYAVRSLNSQGPDAEEGRTFFSLNSDILFKYITLRFYDTNTSISLKTLELLEHMFGIFDINSILMTENEAANFLPHFIIKVGDPKETLRSRVRGIMKMISRVYPASRFIQYLLKGLESKNSRTRSECLDELSSLIQRNGLTAFVPAKTLPVIASQISDRDAAVRNSALNALIQAFLLIGDDIYAHLGKISEKDKDMLIERLKRLPPHTSTHASTVQPTFTNGISAAVNRKSLLPSVSNTESDSIGATQNANRNSSSTKRTFTTGSVDSEYLNESNGGSSYRLGSTQDNTVNLAWSSGESYNHVSGSTQTTNAPPSVPKEFTLDFENMEVRSVNSSQTANAGHGHVSANQSASHLLPESERIDLMIDVMITHVTSLDVNQSIEGLKQLEKLLSTTPDIAGLRINDIISASTLQLRIAFTNLSPLKANIARLVKHISSLLVSIFSKQEFSSFVLVDNLEQCVQEVLLRLVDPTLQTIDSANVLGRALNILMVRIIEGCDCNMTFRVLLRILQRSAATCFNMSGQTLTLHSKHTELVMKCVWKVTKTLPKRLEEKSIRISDILVDIHEFLSLSPPAYWKKRVAENVIPQADMPLRTVKTILHELVNALGKDVREYASDITADSHVQTYLDQMLGAAERRLSRSSRMSRDFEAIKRSSQDMSVPSSPQTRSLLLKDELESQLIQPTRSPGNAFVSTSSQNRRSGDFDGSCVTKELNSDGDQSTLDGQIQYIFSMISDKEKTRMGVQKLYHFQLEHPEAADLVEQRIARTSSYFQGYIRRGLAAYSQSSAAETAASNAAATVAAMNAFGVDGGSNLTGYQRHMSFGPDVLKNVNALEPDTAGGGSADSFRETLTRLQLMFKNSSTSALPSTLNDSNVYTSRPRPASYIDPQSPGINKGSSHHTATQSMQNSSNVAIKNPSTIVANAAVDRQQRSQAVGDLKERLAKMKLAMGK